jgi:hypothetical protein
MAVVVGAEAAVVVEAMAAVAVATAMVAVVGAVMVAVARAAMVAVARAARVAAEWASAVAAARASAVAAAARALVVAVARARAATAMAAARKGPASVAADEWSQSELARLLTVTAKTVQTRCCCHPLLFSIQQKPRSWQSRQQKPRPSRRRQTLSSTRKWTSWVPRSRVQGVSHHLLLLGEVRPSRHSCVLPGEPLDGPRRAAAYISSFCAAFAGHRAAARRRRRDKLTRRLRFVDQASASVEWARAALTNLRCERNSP